MPSISINQARGKRWFFVAVTICFAAALASCSGEPVKQAYRDSSDWLNDIPPPPEAGPWRLSKKLDAADAAYPNLGDVPERPPVSAEQVAADREILAIESTDAGTALKLRTGKRASAASLGAPPPAGMQPLRIPPPQ